MNSPEHAERPPTNHRFLLQQLNACISDHEQCNKDFYGEPRGSDDAPELPTRVLSVGTESDSHLRLLEQNPDPTGSLQRGRYVALSHCWGPPEKHSIKTTTENLKRHLHCISFENLSRTFKDAVTITRKLNVQYLWIDSLCIIQDDTGDWEREAPTMGSVYENAYLTVCATGAADGTEGCFAVAEEELAEVAVFDDNLGFMYNYERAGYDILGPLQSRAWATQEWILSRRQIHYCRGRLAWCCDEVQKFDDGSTVKVVLRTNSDINQGTFEELADISDEDPRREKVKAVWKWIVQEYTERDLTVPKDKLPAIRGLIRKLQHGDEESCPHGIMLDDLPFSLAWSRWENGLYLQRPHELGLAIPSWSWASTKGKVDYARPFSDRVEVLCNCSYDSQSSSLVLQSWLTYSETSLSLMEKGQSHSVLMDEFAAADLRRIDGDDCVYLVVPLTHDPLDSGCDCLILRKLNNGFNVFERIGMAWNLRIDRLYYGQPKDVSTVDQWSGRDIVVK